MLGGGNPVGGSNPSGIGTSINYVGNHAYANSGVIQVNTTEQTHLKFDTGAEYLVGEFELQGAVNLADINDGVVVAFIITMNGEVVAQPKVGTVTEAMPTVEHYKILIPPFSSILVQVKAPSNPSGWKTSASFVGRVYA